jgi:hypothetical protein
MKHSIDKEKVIEGLRHCTAWAGLHECQPRIGPDCPYEDDADCKLALMRDALDLLKEQEDLGTELTNAMELIHKKNKRIKNLEEQIVTLTKWRANAGAFD